MRLPIDTRNLVPKLCLVALAVPVVLVVLYFLVGSFIFIPAAADGSVGAVLIALFFKVVPGLAVVTNILVAVHRAAATKDYLWLIASVLMWPLSFWYTLVETRPRDTGASTAA